MFIITLRGGFWYLVTRNGKEYLISFLLHSHIWIISMNGIKNNYDKNQISLINQIGLYGILIYSSDNIKSLKLLF